MQMRNLFVQNGTKGKKRELTKVGNKALFKSRKTVSNMKFCAVLGLLMKLIKKIGYSGEK